MASDEVRFTKEQREELSREEIEQLAEAASPEYRTGEGRPFRSVCIDLGKVRRLCKQSLSMMDRLASVERERDELASQLNRALDFLERHGYRRCDCPACNCGLWHGGSASERLRELTEALSEAGCQPMQKTLFVAVVDLIAERDALREQLAKGEGAK